MFRESHNLQVFQFFFSVMPMANGIQAGLVFPDCLSDFLPAPQSTDEKPNAFAFEFCTGSLCVLSTSLGGLFWSFGNHIMQFTEFQGCFWSDLRIFFQRRSKSCCAICVLAIKRAAHVRCQIGHQSNS